MKALKWKGIHESSKCGTDNEMGEVIVSRL